MNLKCFRDYNKLFWSIVFCWLYIPHFLAVLILYILSNCSSRLLNVLGFAIEGNKLIFSDLLRMANRYQLPHNKWILLLVCLHTDSYYRSLFYYRIGPILALFISWYRPGYKSFIIPYSTKIDECFCFFHPFSTILNAEKIGENFSCGHSTTIGATGKGRPIIGNNVA